MACYMYVRTAILNYATNKFRLFTIVASYNSHTSTRPLNNRFIRFSMALGFSSIFFSCVSGHLLSYAQYTTNDFSVNVQVPSVSYGAPERTYGLVNVGRHYMEGGGRCFTLWKVRASL